MVDTVAMSANAERVIKPRTFIPPSQVCDAEFASPDRAYGCRERLSNGRASDAAWFPARKGDSRSPRREIMPSLAVSSSPRSADQGCFRGATESTSGATAAGAPRAVHGVFRVRNLVGGTGHYLNSRTELSGGVLDLLKKHWRTGGQPRGGCPLGY